MSHVKRIAKRFTRGHARFIAVVAVLLASVFGARAPHANADQPDSNVTTVVIVRHAEKESMPADDPSLTDAGRRRAHELVRVLSRANVRAVYATQFKRTIETAQPFASQLRVPVKKMAADDIDGLISDIRTNHSGHVVFVVGHSNTVQQIIEKLGCRSPPTIAETEFDSLFFAMVKDSSFLTLVQLKYGPAP